MELLINRLKLCFALLQLCDLIFWLQTLTVHIIHLYYWKKHDSCGLCISSPALLTLWNTELNSSISQKDRFGKEKKKNIINTLHAETLPSVGAQHWTSMSHISSVWIAQKCKRSGLWNMSYLYVQNGCTFNIDIQSPYISIFFGKRQKLLCTYGLFPSMRKS